LVSQPDHLALCRDALERAAEAVDQRDAEGALEALKTAAFEVG
jgi:hypothetical protein